jgi:hypothetical protein
VTSVGELLALPARYLGLHQGLLIATLVVIALIHTRSRIGGALSTAGWCVAATAYGWGQLASRDGGLVFLNVHTPKWVFFSAMAGVFVYNIAIAARALTRKVAAPSSTTPAA